MGGALFLGRVENAALAPSLKEKGDAALVIERSMTGVKFPLTLVVTLAGLLLGLVSAWFPWTEAVLVIAPAVVGVTTTVIVSLAACARLPIRSVSTLPLRVIVPPPASTAETKVALAGSTSATDTPVASLVDRKSVV